MNRTATEALLNGATQYHYSLDIAPLTLSAGTTYWISIVNNSPGFWFEAAWYWASSAGGTSYYRGSDAINWQTYSGASMGFYLLGPVVVPEPASMSLVGLGLAALAVRARRKH